MKQKWWCHKNSLPPYVSKELFFRYYLLTLKKDINCCHLQVAFDFTTPVYIKWWCHKKDSPWNCAKIFFLSNKWLVKLTYMGYDLRDKSKRKHIQASYRICTHDKIIVTKNLIAKCLTDMNLFIDSLITIHVKIR